MPSNDKSVIAVVTGGNRGIGKEICRQLAQRGARVVLTARNAKAGQAAAKELGASNSEIAFHPLDVTDQKSIDALRDHLQRAYGRVDVLVNNAGIVDDNEASGLKVDPDVVRATFETNALAPLRLTQALAPLLGRSDSARVINVSSGLGQLSEMGGDHAAYRISKAALNAISGILAGEFKGKVAVNSVCPGWVKTDMGGPGAEREVAQGADTPVWLALEAPHDLSGKFLRDRKVIAW